MSSSSVSMSWGTGMSSRQRRMKRSRLLRSFASRHDDFTDLDLLDFAVMLSLSAPDFVVSAFCRALILGHARQS